MADIFDLDAYKRFADNLLPLLSGKNIKRVSHEDLRDPAIRSGTRTKFGSYGWRSAVSSRIAPKTVYLGSPYIRQPKLTDLQKNIVANAPQELHNVLHLMRTIPFIHMRMQIGNNPEFNPICNLYMSVADAKNYRIPYMWGHTVRKVGKEPGPEFTMIHIPEEHNIRQQVLVLPEHNINIALGTDYMGEDKKGFLRQSMWRADEMGMLGLHAGTKIVTVMDPHGELRRYGVFMFGLTATGKSTWSCHHLGLDYKAGEGTQVTQDDIVFLKKDGSALGSEDGGFFVKTDVDPSLQEALYNALTDKSALFENVMIDSEGNADFLDETLCANGRSVMKRKKLWIKVGRKKLDISGAGINLPSLDELDGVVFAFITRRNTIMPFAQELTPEQGVLAYLWGESTHSFASQPAKAGESVRIVGTDPFIIGSRGRKVNRFHDIVMHLVEKYPGKVRFFQYNTGGLGEIIKESEEDGVKKKVFIKKAERVPINLMAAIQRGDLKGVNGYEKGMFGPGQIARVEGEDLAKYDPRNFYSQEEIDHYLSDIVKGRMAFTETIAAEGLHDEVIKAAEKSFRIMPKSKDKAFVSTPPGGGKGSSGAPGEEKEEDEESPVERFWKPAGRMPAPPRHRNR